MIAVPIDPKTMERIERIAKSRGTTPQRIAAEGTSVYVKLLEDEGKVVNDLTVTDAAIRLVEESKHK